MRKFVLMIFVMVAMAANAQWKVVSVDKQEHQLVKLLQVLETENSVLIYGTVTQNKDAIDHLFIDRKTAVVKNNMRYKIKNAVNFPIRDEAEPRYLHLSNIDEKVNFVMEFEKFDVNSGFDIVENDSKHGSSMMNFYGVNLEKISEKEMLDTERFLDCSNTIWGYYIENNRRYNYFIRDGLMIEYYDKWYDNDWLLYINIVNNSDHGVMFDRDKLFAKLVDSNGETLKFTRYTPDSYDSYIDRDLYQQATNNTGGSKANETIRELDKAKSEATDEWTKFGLSALKAMTEKAQENRVRKYLEEHPRTIPKALRSTSIRSGESIFGFIPYKLNRKKAKFIFNLYIDNTYFQGHYNFNN